MEEKQKYLNELAKLDTIVLQRLVEVSKSEKALSFFTNVFQFAVLKSFLKK